MFITEFLKLCKKGNYALSSREETLRYQKSPFFHRKWLEKNYFNKWSKFITTARKGKYYG